MLVSGFVAEAFGWLMFLCASMQPLLPTYFHLITSAILPIYSGAHASLSRPSSAAPPQKRKDDLKCVEDEDNDAPVIDMAGMTTQDAIAMPIIAAMVLTGLYFLIKWLQNPQLINMLINGYLGLYGLFAITILLRDAFDLLNTLLFPKYYTDGGHVYKFDLEKRCVEVISGQRELSRSSPLPGAVARISMPKVIHNLLWYLRAVTQRKLIIVRASWGLETGQLKFNLYSILGFALALTSLTYYNFMDRPWWLTNLFGFAFCYGSLQIISPTTFSIGTLALCALFLYDIYMVFFTPMMVTVALAIDAPIKMVFPKPGKMDEPSQAFAMLGLGDIVIPGIMIGHALRFDLFLFYLRKQKRTKQTDMASTAVSRNEVETIQPAYDGLTPRNSEDRIHKAPYISTANSWGSRLWTTRIFGKSHPLTQELPGVFPKVYFSAGITGYLIGIIVTLIGMHASNHAQPALLYLVPAVLTSLWGTAWWKGDWRLFCDFSDGTNEEDESPAKDSKAQKGDAESFQVLSRSDDAKHAIKPSGKESTTTAKNDLEYDEDGEKSSRKKATQSEPNLLASMSSETKIFSLSLSFGALPPFVLPVESTELEGDLNGSIKNQDGLGSYGATRLDGHVDKKPRIS